MNREDFIKHIETDSRLMVDNARITTPHGTWEGHGVMQCIDGDFLFTIHLPEGSQPPPPVKGLIQTKDFWKMEGILENSLPFVAPSFSPCGGANRHNDLFSLPLHVNTLELPPAGWDAMTQEEREAVFDRNDPLSKGEAKTTGSQTDDPTGLQPVPPLCVEFRGVLKGFKVMARNGGTDRTVKNDFHGDTGSSSLDTCHGKLGNEWDFGFTQQGDDMTFCLKSREGYQSKGEKEDMAKFQAFMDTVGFFYGRHPWPFTLQYWRNHTLILDRINAPEKREGSPHLPFPEAIWFNARVGNLEWNVENVFTRAYSYFVKDTVLSETITRILFYMREATKRGVHNRISVMSLCALLENLVRAICRSELRTASDRTQLERILASGGITSPKLKDTTLSMDALLKALFEEMKNSRVWPAEKVFKRAFFIAGLKWEDRAEQAFQFWELHRNDILHDGRHEQDDATLLDEIYVESRLAGAINILVLRLMGYEGVVSASAFEDAYHKI
jgi:hypothetical protein